MASDSRELRGTSGFPLAEQFLEISRELLAERGRQPTLDLLVRLAVETVPTADECGVTVRREDGTFGTPAATTSLVAELDELQVELAEGPCFDTAWTLDTNIVEDLASETRWPQWCRRAVARGMGSILSVRIATPDEWLGSLNLYARTASRFDHSDVMVASIFARHAASAMEVADRAQNWQAALRTRQAIGIAQGMLMQRFGLDMDQSFEVLRRFSQEQNIKVRDLAEQLVDAGSIIDSIGNTMSSPHGEDKDTVG